MSSVACNNQFNLVLDVQDKNPQSFLSDSDQMRRLLVSLVQSAIRYSSDQIVQISVRVQEDDDGVKRISLNRPDNLSTEIDSCYAVSEQQSEKPCSSIPSVKPVSVDLNRFEFPPCTILIVDDLGETHLALAQILKPYHFGWIHTYNVDETLDKVQRYFPDLILMDVCFPGSRQTQIVRQIRAWEQSLYRASNAARQNREREPIQTVEPTSSNEPIQTVGKIPIIAFSSYADPKQDDLLLASGCSDILHKPLSPESLVTMLAKWLSAWENPDESENDVINVVSDLAASSWENRRREWIPQCESMSKRISFSEIKRFSEDVHQFGEQIHSCILIRWAEKLLHTVRSYDLTKLKKMLLEFSSLSIR